MKWHTKNREHKYTYLPRSLGLLTVTTRRYRSFGIIVESGALRIHMGRTIVAWSP